MKFSKTTALFCIAFLLLAARLVLLSHAPFINDEPRLQVAIDTAIAHGEIPVIGPQGSQPIPYGPVPHWVYRAVRLVSAAPLAPHWAAGILFLLAELCAVWAIYLSCGISIALTSAFLLAASPWFYVYARMPWEVLLLVPASSLMLLAFSFYEQYGHKKKSSYLCAAGIFWALGAAMALGTHLMAMSLWLASFAVFWVEFFRKRVARKRLLLFAGTSFFLALLLLWPYLHALWLGKYWLQQGANQNAHWGDGRQLWWSVLKTPMYLSVWQMKYFLNPEEQSFFLSLALFWRKLFYADIFGWITKFLCLGASLGVFVGLYQRKSHPLIFTFGAFGFLFQIFILQYFNLATYPHYFLPFWWAVFLFAALASRKLVGRVILFSLIGVNLIFLGFFISYLEKHRGTRGDYYGSFFAEEKNLFHEICLLTPPSTRVEIDLSEVHLRSFTVEYFANHLDECKGKTLAGIEVPVTNKPHIRVYYPVAQSAAFAWSRVE